MYVKEQIEIGMLCHCVTSTVWQTLSPISCTSAVESIQRLTQYSGKFISTFLTKQSETKRYSETPPHVPYECQ